MGEWVELHLVTGMTAIVDMAGALVEPIPPEEERPGNCRVYRLGVFAAANPLAALEVTETLADFQALLSPKSAPPVVTPYEAQAAPEADTPSEVPEAPEI